MILPTALHENLRGVRNVDGLRTFWDFERSSVSHRQKWQRAKCFLWKWSLRPGHQRIAGVFPAPRWNVLFAFCPDGVLSPAQVFTLRSLRATGHPLLVICAAKSPSQIPVELRPLCDSLYWKALPGYDFSAYRLALEIISEYSSGATVFMMNDSVFGPFGDLNPFVDHSPWDLTGFSSSALAENHIQSFAFVLRNVTASTLDKMSPVLFPDKVFNRLGAVILCQELRLARVASRSMTVGSYWYSPFRNEFDPMLHLPFELIGAGLPFLKRSLLGKMAGFQNPERVRRQLRDLGHPNPL